MELVNRVLAAAQAAPLVSACVAFSLADFVLDGAYLTYGRQRHVVKTAAVGGW